MTVGRIALLLAAATALEFLVGSSRYRAALPVDWLLSQQMFGMNAFAKAAIGYALAIISVRIVFGGALAVGAALAAASLANDLIVGVLGFLLLQAPIVVASPDSLWRAGATGLTLALLYSAEKFPWREWWQKRRLRRLR